MPKKESIICLFDVDGTLTRPRRVIDPDMLTFLVNKLHCRCPIALVGGSDLSKIAEQMGGMDVLNKFEYVFSENGLVAMHFGNEIGKQNIQTYIGEESLQKFINFCLRYMSELSLPIKRGTFVEFRNGLINICPVGRSCSQEERDQFYEYDKEHRIREKFIEAIRKEFPDSELICSIGGQISFDVFPKGWDKTYCLRYLEDFDEIHFFGDKTDSGGNDYEIYVDSRTIGHRVEGPEDTKRQLMQLFDLP